VELFNFLKFPSTFQKRPFFRYPSNSAGDKKTSPVVFAFLQKQLKVFFKNAKPGFF